MSALLRIICLAAILLGGCGGGPTPTLDTSTDATADASLKAMTAGMSDAEKKRFDDDCGIIAAVSKFDDSPGSKGTGPKDKLRKLEGLTAEEIHAKAAALRLKLSR